MSIRVCNLNLMAKLEHKAQPDEMQVRIDSENQYLGHGHKYFEPHQEFDREESLEDFKIQLQMDLLSGGPMTSEIERLAIELNAGKKLALMCWCKPRACHGDSISHAIQTMAKVLRAEEEA